MNFCESYGAEKGIPRRMNKLFAVVFFEILQECDQRLNALLGHGVVDGGAQAADGLVALEVVKACSLGGGDDLGVQLLGLGASGPAAQRCR